VTLNLDFKVTVVIFMPIDALSVLCAQLTRDLLAIAKFLYYIVITLGSGAKNHLSGITPANPNRSGPNLADMHRSRGNNVQSILGVIGPVRAKWGWTSHAQQSCFCLFVCYAMHSVVHNKYFVVTTPEFLAFILRFGGQC